VSYVPFSSFTAKFCGGVAHKGIADKALKLLQHPQTVAILTTALKEYPDYRLVLTGHSLGAGVASLLLLKLQFDGHYWVREPREVRCVGFGCPPVFGAPVSSPSMQGMVGFQRTKTALSKIMCFINGQDAIPFLSVDAIRRLAHMMQEVDEFTKTLYPTDVALMVRGLKTMPPELVQIVVNGSKALPQVSGAERLKIPGQYVLWMDDCAAAAMTRDNHVERKKSDVVCCRPSELSNLAIHLSDQFIADHMPPRYEERIGDILS
jgi:Lipase (class 3)